MKQWLGEGGEGANSSGWEKDGNLRLEETQRNLNRQTISKRNISSKSCHTTTEIAGTTETN